MPSPDPARPDPSRLDPTRAAFLVAGVQKGGTTALFDYLAEHPDLNLPAVKEVHFFDEEAAVDWSAPDYAAYHAAFAAGAARRPAALWGEATPIYIYWPDALERIRDYNPGMRFVVIFRDPAERAWSHWKMESVRGAETEPFGWCIRQGRDRVRAGTEKTGAHRVHSYVERGFYGAQVRRLLTFFPLEQVLFLRSDELRRAPERILGGVCDFLRVSRFVDVVPRESHLGPSGYIDQMLVAEDRQYLTSLFVEDQKVFRSITGIDFQY